MNEARIEHICDKMRNLTFRTGDTVRDLAKEWSLTEHRLRELTAEASKRVRAELTDPDRIVVKVASSLEKVIDDAMRETEDPATIEGQGGRVYQESPNHARKVVVEAAKTLAILTGANAPQRVQVETVNLSRAQLMAELEEELKRLREMPPDEDDGALALPEASLSFEPPADE